MLPNPSPPFQCIRIHFIFIRMHESVCTHAIMYTFRPPALLVTNMRTLIQPLNLAGCIHEVFRGYEAFVPEDT